MTSQSSPPLVTASVDAGRQVAQLRHVLGLVEQIAGRGAEPRNDNGLDENALISSAYEAAPAIVQHRFDALAGEMSAWAAAGVQALIAARSDDVTPQAAAAGLADALDSALAQLSRLVQVHKGPTLPASRAG